MKYDATMMGFPTRGGTRGVMDMSYDNSTLLIGNNDELQTYSVNSKSEYWFEHKRNFILPKSNMSSLAWNTSSGSQQKFAVGTFNKQLLIYTTNSSKYEQSQQAFEDSYIRKIEWVPNDRNCVYFISENSPLIGKWDIREKQKNKVQKLDSDSEFNKINDFQFNKHKNQYFAILNELGGTTIYDTRKMGKVITQKLESDSGGEGKLRWDPNRNNRLAYAGGSQIIVWNTESQFYEERKLSQSKLKIRDFWWRKRDRQIGEYFFTVSSQQQGGTNKYTFYNQQILQYDLSPPQEEQRFHSYFVSEFYNNRLQYWILDREEKLLFTWSGSSRADHRELKRKHSQKDTEHIVLAQHLTNCVKSWPDNKFVMPLMFDNDNGLATCVKQVDEKNKTFISYPVFFCEREISSTKIIKEEYKKLQEKKYGKINPPEVIEHIFTGKDEMKFLYYHYLKDPSIPTAIIAEHNKQVARCFDSQSKKLYCQPIWQVIFAFAEPQKCLHTLDSLYEDRVPTTLKFQETKIYISNQDDLNRTPPPANIQKKIQFLADQNEIYAAVVAGLLMYRLKKDSIQPDFLIQLLNALGQILNRWEMYEITAELMTLTKIETLTEIYKEFTTFSMACGKCNKNFMKCVCNLKCILCSKPLKTGYIMWCKICGHGGHAKQYEEWFKVHKECPHNCGHHCFS